MPGKIFLSPSCRALLPELEGQGFEETDKPEDADVILAENGDGEELCRKIRLTDTVPGIILVYNGNDGLHEGYECGADICTAKPFAPGELADMVQALFRRVKMCRPDNEKLTICGECALDHRRRALIKNDRVTELTQIEYSILECFFSSPDTVMAREKILSHVWGGNYYGEEKVVDVNIRRLRVKVEDDPSHPEHLVTVWGRGYMWKTR